MFVYDVYVVYVYDVYVVYVSVVYVSDVSVVYVSDVSVVYVYVSDVYEVYDVMQWVYMAICSYSHLPQASSTEVNPLLLPAVLFTN